MTELKVKLIEIKIFYSILFTLPLYNIKYHLVKMGPLKSQRAF